MRRKQAIALPKRAIAAVTVIKVLHIIQPQHLQGLAQAGFRKSRYQQIDMVGSSVHKHVFDRHDSCRRPEDFPHKSDDLYSSKKIHNDCCRER
jgi:hypothetical protein